MILPTTGRETLQAARESCAGFDEVIVVEDNTGDRGYRARTEGITRATGTHLAFLDDDDVFLPGTADLMRKTACDVPVIFRMDDPFHGVIWRQPELTYGNVGSPMLLVPNDPERLGTWEPVEFGRGPGRGGDYHFLQGCVQAMGEPVWREEIICRVRPHERTSITVVTPWLNHPEFIPDYMHAIDCGQPEELLVVDNGSDPPLDLPGIRLDSNAGFCAANNIGLWEATSEAVLFLNNDVAATSADWLQRIRAAVQHGVLVGAKLRFDPHASVDGSPLPYLDGWCLAGMTDDLKDLGGWDETLLEPAYYSDNDLCLRARAAGMALKEVRAGIRHKLNGTAKSGDPVVVSATLGNRERYVALARELVAA